MASTGTHLADAFMLAQQAGHWPGLYRRDKGLWRVHLDVGGNEWKDVKTLDQVAAWLLKKTSDENRAP